VDGFPELGECEYRDFPAMDHDFQGVDLFASGYKNRHLQTTCTRSGSHLHAHLHMAARTHSEQFIPPSMSSRLPSQKLITLAFLLAFDDQSDKACFSIMFSSVPQNVHGRSGLVCFVNLTDIRYYAIIAS